MPRPTDRSVSQHVGTIMLETREKRGISRTAMARAMNMSEVALHHYEMGNRRINVDVLHVVAGLLGKPVTHFMKGLDTPTPTALHKAEPASAE